MSHIDIDRLINYEAEYRNYLKGIKPSKGNIVSLCPFHQDKKPSFSVNLKNGNYKCFACGEEGNYITFRAKMMNTSTEDAYKKILEELHIEPEKEVPKKYSLQDYSNEKKLPMDYLKQSWKLDDFRDGIKLPYFDLAGNTKATRYRKINKQFTWAKGSKVCIYGLEKMDQIRKQGFVVLVEGESDTQTLFFHSVPVLGIPGASTFQEQWVAVLKGLKVFIHHEGDAGADTFIKKVCSALHKHDFEDEVYKISCRAVGVKDPNELHTKANDNKIFDAKWTEIMAQAQRIDLEEFGDKIPVLIEGAPINLREPAGWHIRENGVYKIDEKTSLDILVMRTPMLLLNRMHSLDTGEEKIEIAFLRDKKWKTAIYPRSLIFSTRNICVLADLGLMVTSENAKDIVRYLGDLEIANLDVLKLKKCVNQLGWYDESFMPFVKNELILDIEKSTQRWLNAYESEGKLEDWIAKMRTYRNENHIFRFLLASSFATPLLKILNHRTFFIHNWADSRTGKTACLRASLSVWGDSEELITSFNATKVGLERMAGFFNDLPLGIDERQVAGNNNQDFIESLVYMLGLGGSKLRGAKSGGLQAMKSWRTIVMTTGEEPLSNMTSQTGVATRVLEVYGSPFNNERKAKEMYDITQQTYGTAGAEFIKLLLEKYGGKFEELKERHRQIVMDLEKEMDNKVSTHISGVAMVILSDLLVSEWLFKEQDQGLSYLAGFQILHQLGSAQEVDIVEKAYEYIKSWCFSNRESFQSYSKPCYGFIGNTGNMFYIFPHIIENEMTLRGFPYRKILKGFSERGYLMESNNGAGYQVQVRANGTRIRYIAVRILDAPEIAKKSEDEDKKIIDISKNFSASEIDEFLS